MMSTMQWLSAENEKLRRTGRMDRIVYWTCILGVGLVVAAERWL